MSPKLVLTGKPVLAKHLSCCFARLQSLHVLCLLLEWITFTSSVARLILSINCWACPYFLSGDGSKKARCTNFMLVIVTTYGALTLNNQSRAPPLRILSHGAFPKKIMPASLSCPVHASAAWLMAHGVSDIMRKMLNSQHGCKKRVAPTHSSGISLPLLII